MNHTARTMSCMCHMPSLQFPDDVGLAKAVFRVQSVSSHEINNIHKTNLKLTNHLSQWPFCQLKVITKFITCGPRSFPLRRSNKISIHHRIVSDDKFFIAAVKYCWTAWLDYATSKWKNSWHQGHSSLQQDLPNVCKTVAGGAILPCLNKIAVSIDHKLHQMMVDSEWRSCSKNNIQENIPKMIILKMTPQNTVEFTLQHIHYITTTAFLFTLTLLPFTDPRHVWILIHGIANMTDDLNLASLNSI